MRDVTRAIINTNLPVHSNSPWSHLKLS